MIDVKKYKENGFLLLKNFLIKEELDKIRNEAKKIFMVQMYKHQLIHSYDITDREFEINMYKLFNIDLKHIIYCGKQAQHLISLHELSLNKKIVTVLKSLGIEFPIINVRPVIFFNSSKLAKRTEDWRKPSHQDWRTTQGSLDSIVVWVPLIDINKPLGALEIVSGSHKLGLLNYELVNDYQTVSSNDENQMQFESVEVEKGDALFFSTLLVHRSGDNITDSIRWSCHFRYNNLLEPSFIQRGFPHSYIYKPQNELITPSFPSKNDAKVFFEK